MAHIRIFPEEIRIGDTVRRFNNSAKFFESRVCEFHEVIGDPVFIEKMGLYTVEIQDKKTLSRQKLCIPPDRKTTILRYE